MASPSESWRPFFLLVAAVLLSAGMTPRYVSATGRGLLQSSGSPPYAGPYAQCQTDADCGGGLECEIDTPGATSGYCYFAPSGPGGPCRYGHLARNCQEGLYCLINETDFLGGSGYCESQGVCGTGAARDFPLRCYFNSDPQGRYVCCDSNGCDGFESDNLTPHCAANGFVPPGDGVQGQQGGTPPVTPPVAPPVPPPVNPPPQAGAAPAGALVDPSVACPFRNGFATNSCFNEGGDKHVCCVNPDSCGGFDANGGPTCTNNNYVIFA